jgi:alpha-L-fucosidase
MGDWLHTNGQAIYNTRPWIIFGEGPTTAGKNSKAMNSDIQVFTAEDIRFTVPKDHPTGHVYATALGWPASGTLRIQTMGSTLPYLGAPVCSVSLIGSDEKLSWKQQETGLFITLPQHKPNDIAYVFNIQSGSSCSK